MKYLPKTTGDTSALLGHNFDSCDRQHYTQYCPITNNRFTSRPELAVLYRTILHVFGGFQLLDLIIPELKSHVIPYKFKCSHWLRANLVKDFFFTNEVSTNEST